MRFKQVHLVARALVCEVGRCKRQEGVAWKVLRGTSSSCARCARSGWCWAGRCLCGARRAPPSGASVENSLPSLTVSTRESLTRWLRLQLPRCRHHCFTPDEPAEQRKRRKGSGHRALGGARWRGLSSRNLTTTWTSPTRTSSCCAARTARLWPPSALVAQPGRASSRLPKRTMGLCCASTGAHLGLWRSLGKNLVRN